ncbi:synaptotagmin-6 isoform X1 [Neodiprion pinetum]|uniref:synaptotagmin-6 isoform X1 n=1 Tax=Neodiprion fabricii TaxID=2872261 RepID=UPI001ED8CDD0|nr:synaptotagmin-6 isoform X1 [Neodiprion fabricii]XP_046414449.1 synaptotagmin-6 isoform X1 [Neodiprion fabricii]XP_046469449.1 synaptotagmin-6 isoform X1 [Neodiprion pinetum]
MDTRSVSGVATLVALGAAGAGVGTLLAILVYAVCARRRVLLGAVGGPLNWFEKDLLDRAETARSKEVLVGLGTGTSGSEDKVWPHNAAHDNLALESSGAVSLSESESALISPVSPGGPGIAPPLPGGPLVASEKLVILAKPRTIPSMHTRLDHTKIDTALYQQVNSGATSPSESEDSRGELQLSLFYDAPAGILTVRLIEAHDLQAREMSGTADPYAKIRLLPDRSNVWQTRIHKRTLNPVFDEDFVFEVIPAVAIRRTLEVLLYDFDAFSRHHNIGCVQLPLSSVDLGSRATITKPILRCTERDVRAELGELMVSISFLPSAERLTVIVIKARNLRVVDDTRTSSDPYVKVSIISEDGKRLKKRKSGVQRNTTNPVWNVALTFDLGRDLLSRSSIEFLILHDSLLGASETLARCTVSAKSQRDLFHEVLAGRGATAQWLPLAETRQT